MTRPSWLMDVSAGSTPRRVAAVIECQLEQASRVMAAGGALLIVAMMLVVVASVLGRGLFSSPVPGVYELVEFGMAIAITAFLPYCQFERGNVIVDFFTHAASNRTKALLEAVGNTIYLLVAALITWRLAMGGIDAFHWGGGTMVLRLPNWWVFPPMVLSTGLLTLVCGHSVFSNLRGIFHDGN